MINYLRMMAAALLLASGTAQAGSVMVSDAWVREAPPGATALAGYMTVMNHGDGVRTLVGASSPAFGHVMLHRTVMENGVAKMVHQMKVVVPAGESLVFEPSGYHLMMMKPKQALKAGDRVPLTLEFANGETLQLQYEVRGMAGMDHGGMNHGAMDHGSMHH